MDHLCSLTAHRPLIQSRRLPCRPPRRVFGRVLLMSLPIDRLPRWLQSDANSRPLPSVGVPAVGGTVDRRACSSWGAARPGSAQVAVKMLRSHHIGVGLLARVQRRATRGMPKAMVLPAFAQLVERTLRREPPPKICLNPALMASQRRWSLASYQGTLSDRSSIDPCGDSLGLAGSCRPGTLIGSGAGRRSSQSCPIINSYNCSLQDKCRK